MAYVGLLLRVLTRLRSKGWADGVFIWSLGLFQIIPVVGKIQFPGWDWTEVFGTGRFPSSTGSLQHGFLLP